jgi:putative hydrolase of the HAD superfamily
MSIRLVGFDADDTLWRSEDYYRAAQATFEEIVAGYVDLDDVHHRLYAVEKRNLALFGYGAKGMALSMIEAAIGITGQRISAGDLHRIVELGKELLRHPVDLLPGIREAVAAIARDHEVVLVTKGDLFHQEAKVRESGLADLFPRIEIVSEKDPATYARVLSEFGLPASAFAMIGNSLRSDVLPVLELGGWAVHMPYRVTWVHESDAVLPGALAARMRTADEPAGLADAVRALGAAAAAVG